jgi:hypothetical protein
MPLLKPPEPQIAVRKFYVRIEEPLALAMERYAEFLGADNLDHVVGFIFKRDTQFKSWPEQNPETTPKPVWSKISSEITASNGGTGRGHIGDQTFCKQAHAESLPISGITLYFRWPLPENDLMLRLISIRAPLVYAGFWYTYTLFLFTTAYIA